MQDFDRLSEFEASEQTQNSALNSGALAFACKTYVSRASSSPSVALLAAVQDIYSILRISLSDKVAVKRRVFQCIQAGNLIDAALAAVPKGFTLTIEPDCVQIRNGRYRQSTPMHGKPLEQAVIIASFQLLERNPVLLD